MYLKEWQYYSVDGPLYFLTILQIIKPFALVLGIIGLVAAIQLNPNAAKFYYLTKLTEMIVLPTLGLLSAFDMCNSYMYYQRCSDIFAQQAVASAFKLGYYFYVAYIARSFQRRLERGEIILVSHGKAIVDLVNQIQTSNR